MSALDLLDHFLNFVAPAFVVGVLLAFGSRWLLPAAGGPAWWVQLGVGVAAGVLALVGGLVVFGRDGKMLSYAALVIACAAARWWTGRGWRR